MSGPQHRILIVENDFTIAANLYRYLELQGFLPDAAYDGHAALGLLEQHDFDAVVLDIGLPGIDGYGVLQAIRKGPHASLPVLMLTARDQLDDKLSAFSLGADDYLIKPFALAEVQARLHVMLRHAAHVPTGTVYSFAGVQYDASEQKATVHGQPLHLTRKSSLILQTLLQSPQRLVSRKTLEHVLWPGQIPSSEALRSQMHLLRKSLQEAGFDGIETVHGTGWRLVDH